MIEAGEMEQRLGALGLLAEDPDSHITMWLTTIHKCRFRRHNELSFELCKLQVYTWCAYKHAGKTLT